MMKTCSFSPKYPQVTQLAARYWRHSWCSTAGHPSYILLPWWNEAWPQAGSSCQPMSCEHPSDRAERRCTRISPTSRTTQLVKRPLLEINMTPLTQHWGPGVRIIQVIQWNRREGTKGFPESMILHYWNCVATLWAHGHGPISLNTNASSTSMFSNHPWHMLGRRCPQGTLCRNLGRKRLRDAFSQLLWHAPHRLLLSGLPNHWSKGSCEAKQCFERAATLTCVIWRKTQSYAIICNLLDLRLCEKQSAHKHTT